MASYQLSSKEEEHQQLLHDLLDTAKKQEEDVFLVSKEGHRIFTNRLLLSLYSPFLREMFVDISKDTPIGISIPLSFQALVNLIKIITEGKAESGDQESLAEVGPAGSFVGIAMDNLNLVASDGSSVDSRKDEDSFDFDCSEDNVYIGIKAEASDENNEIISDINKKVKKRKTGPKQSLNLKCNDCEKVFSERGNFNRHALTHSGIKRFSCEDCETKFARADKLKLHITQHHSVTGSENFGCEECDKTFTRKDHLSRHNARVHTVHASVSGEVNSLII